MQVHDELVWNRTEALAKTRELVCALMAARNSQYPEGRQWQRRELGSGPLIGSGCVRRPRRCQKL